MFQKSLIFLLSFISLIFIMFSQLYSQKPTDRIFSKSNHIGEIIALEKQLCEAKTSLILTRENISVNEAIHTKDSLSSLPDSALRCIKPPLNPVRIIVEIRSIDYISVNGDTQMKDSLSSLPDSVLRNMKPPLSPGRILGEVGAGILGSIAGAFGGALIFGAIYYGSGGGVDENAFNAIMITGFSLGSSGGVYLVGNKGNQTGSFWATVSSSAIGGILGLAFSYKSELKGKGVLPFLGSVIGATIGFNMTRSYQLNPVSETALLNFRNGQIRYAVPIISLNQNPYDRSICGQSIEIVRVEF